MNSDKKSFQVGDRVAVYGWVQMHHTPYIPRAGGKATVAWVTGADIHVRFDEPISDENNYPVHPKRLRRLVRKPKREWALGKIDGNFYHMDGCAFDETDEYTSDCPNCIAIEALAAGEKVASGEA